MGHYYSYVDDREHNP
jgi:hypothetical protein